MLKTNRQVDIFSASAFKEPMAKYPGQKYRHFNRLFVAIALTPLIGIGAFNLAIDPYGIFHTPTIRGINAAKPEKFKQDTLINAIEVMYRNPNIIFLGSSRAQWGLDPSHPAFAPGDEVYNLAVQGVNMYEVRRYFDHALANQPQLKQVIISMDELMFSEFVTNRPGFSEARLGKRFITLEDFLSTVLSWDAFSASQTTLSVSREQSDHIQVGKFLVAPDVFVDGMLRLDPTLATPGSVENFTGNLTHRLRPNRADGRYSDYQVSADHLNHLRAIAQVCQERGIDLKLFIAPEHAMLFEAMQLRFGAEIEHWKRELVKIAPVWDFSGYNSITTEPLSADMTYYLDSSHYSPETGRLVFNRILSYQPSTVPDDFGVLITPANLESHLATVRANRALWIEAHPDLAAIVQGIKRD